MHFFFRWQCRLTLNKWNTISYYRDWVAQTYSHITCFLSSNLCCVSMTKGVNVKYNISSFKNYCLQQDRFLRRWHKYRNRIMWMNVQQEHTVRLLTISIFNTPVNLFRTMMVRCLKDSIMYLRSWSWHGPK
jgi:hypothetical protein